MATSTIMMANTIPPLKMFSPFHEVEASKIEFALPINTNGELKEAMESFVQPHVRKVATNFLVVTSIVIVLILSGLGYLLFYKGKMGKLWLFGKRNTPHGTFIVPNSVLILVFAVVTYLAGWLIFASVALWTSFRNGYFLVWIWIVPYPWMGLMTFSCMSVYGFILSCSPKSPLSSVGVSHKSLKKYWFLPVCKQAWLMNFFLIFLPIVGFILMTWIQVKAGVRCYPSLQVTRALMKDLEALTPDQLAAPTDPSLLWRSKVLRAQYANCFRWSEIGLFIPGIVVDVEALFMFTYGVPIVINMIHRTYYMYPGHTQQSDDDDKSLWQKTKFLFGEGRLSLNKGETFMVYQNTWKMTIFCAFHVLLLSFSPPLYANCAIIINTPGWRLIFIEGKPASFLTDILVYISLVTVVSCAYCTLLSIMITFDPVFRTIVGLTLKPSSSKTSSGTSTASAVSNFVGTASKTGPTSPLDIPPQEDLEMCTSRTQDQKVEVTEVLTDKVFDEYGDGITITTETMVRCDRLPSTPQPAYFTGPKKHPFATYKR